MREAGKDPQDSEHLLWVVTELGGFCLLGNNYVNQWSQEGGVWKEHWTHEGAQVPKKVRQDGFALGQWGGFVPMPG